MAALLIPRADNDAIDPIIELAKQRLLWRSLCKDEQTVGNPIESSFSENENTKMQLLTRAICPQYFAMTGLEDSVAQYLTDTNILQLTDVQLVELIQQGAKMKNQSSTITDAIDSAYRELTDKPIVQYQLQVQRPVCAPNVSDYNPLALQFQIAQHGTFDIAISEFERFAFDNRVKYSLYTDSSFASYFYHNTLHAFGYDADNLETDNRWQAKLCRYIVLTNFSNLFAIQAFEKDSITYDGTTYNTVFVPKFPVMEIQRQRHHYEEIATKAELCSSQFCKNISESSKKTLFEYRNALNVRATNTIPEQYRLLFRVFPFKDNHWINYRNGQIQLLPLPKLDTPVPVSLEHSLQLMLSLYNVDAIADECSRDNEYNHVLNFASSTDNLALQGMALIVLRLMTGNRIVVDEHTHIELPFKNEIFAMLKMYCKTNRCGDIVQSPNADPATLLFPLESKYLLLNPKLIDHNVVLIKMIADVALSSLHCAYLCSNYTIPETMYGTLFRKISTAEEVYAFLTICIQDTGKVMFREYRSRLDVKWIKAFEPTVTQDQLFSDFTPNARTAMPYDDIETKIEMHTVDNVRPQDVTHSIMATIPRMSTIDTFKFVDMKLDTIVRYQNLDNVFEHTSKKEKYLMLVANNA